MRIDGVDTYYATRVEAENAYRSGRCERSAAVLDPCGRTVYAVVNIPAPGCEPGLDELADLGLPVDPRLREK